MAQIDQERDTRPAWLRGCSIDVKDITSQTLQGSEPTQPKMGKEPSRKGSTQLQSTPGKNSTSSPSQPKGKVNTGLDTVARANLNPVFLNVLEDVMGVDSDDDYEEPEIDYLDARDRPTPEPDYDDHPTKAILRPRHKTISATRSLDMVAKARPSSFESAPFGGKTPHHRHSSGSEDIKHQNPHLQTDQRNHSVPNISSGLSGLTTLPRDFAPNLRITASHQARLLREAGRGTGQGSGSGAPGTGINPLKKHSLATGRNSHTVSSRDGLLRTQSMPVKRPGGIGRTSNNIQHPPPDYDHDEEAPSAAPSRGQNTVLENLQKAMSSGWFYGYGIVVKNLKERLEYISKHQSEKPGEKPKKSIEIARPRGKESRDSATYEAGMTRELAVEILRRQRVGSYILRNSISSPGNLAISVKTVRGRDPRVINHFLIFRKPSGSVTLKDFSREWPNLKAFTNALAQAVKGGRDPELCRHLGIR